MNAKSTQDPFCDSTYENEMHLAEAELSAFISAVTELFGPIQARIAARLADRLAPHRISERPVTAASAFVVRLRSSA